MLTSSDRIDVTPDGEGCRVRYHAELTLNGPLGVFDAFLKGPFRKIGERAERQRLRELVDAARERTGVTGGSEEQRALPDAVRREPAVLPLALIGAAALLLVVSFFL